MARLADQRDDALRLAERIGADEMGTFGEALHAFQKPGDLLAVVRMAEHRQAEGRLGDEDIAGHEFEAFAGRVAAALVVARDDDARAVLFNRDLGGPQHMAGRMEGDGNAVDCHRLAEPCFLR